MAISKIGSNSVNLASGLDVADGDITVASGHGLSFSATADTSVSGSSTSNKLSLNIENYAAANYDRTTESSVTFMEIAV